MKRPFGIVITIILSTLFAAAVACSSATDTATTSGGQPVPAQPPPPPPDAPSIVKTPAPIESVRIDKVAAKPPNATLVVVSGLPNACYEFGGHTITRDGESFDVTITNLLTAGPDIACAEIYRTVETEIPLDEPGVFFGQIEACEVYDLTVNGNLHSVQAIDPSVRCAAPGAQSGDADSTVSVPAPIESVAINVAESFPPQYFVQVRSGLPNGCTRFDAFEVRRDGDVINIDVTNLVPADPNTLCTQVYGTVDSNIPLGSDFVGGTKYTVIVNDVTKTFVAQGEVPQSQTSNSELGVPFSVDFGRTAVIESEGLEIRFSAVTEDSRCPTNVVCIWEGRAKIQVDVSQNGESLGSLELTLQAGMDDFMTQVIGKYSVKLSALDPHPETTVSTEESDYAATLVVTEASNREIE